MQYFESAADMPERIGKVIGDIFAALVIVAFTVIFVQSMIAR